MKPFVKWAGGKRQILPLIKNYIDGFIADCDGKFRYFEPFVGGGAVFFDVQPKYALISDANSDLINAYKVIKSEHFVDLIRMLREHSKNYLSDPDGYYYSVREMDRCPDWNRNPSSSQECVVHAARMIFLNKTCYNGLYRVNAKGQFNTPIGRYKHPLICDEKNIEEIHYYLSDSNKKIMIQACGYEESLLKARDGAIVYLDPPYDYEDDDGFTKYQMAGFTFEDFKNLKKISDRVVNRGANVVISNNDTTKVIELFERDPKYKVCYLVDRIETLRSINSDGEGRRTGREVIIVGTSYSFPQANDMKGIIKLACLTNEELHDASRIKDIVNVQTDRQIAYYLSALMYLGILDKNHNLTEEGRQIGGDQKKAERAIFSFLNEDEELPFKKTFDRLKSGKETNIEEISKCIPNKSSLAKATRLRRASTVLKWAQWMLDFQNNSV